MDQQETIILTKRQIDNKIKRIAYQVYETNANEESVVVAGIKENGFILAQKIKSAIEEIAPLQVLLCEVIIDKRQPTNPISTSIPASEYQNKSILLVDDVLHSGTTLIYGVKHFLEVPLTQFKTAVLVDRNHKKYPIKVDFKGISLSTSINENVAVIFDNNNERAILE